MACIQRSHICIGLCRIRVCMSALYVPVCSLASRHAQLFVCVNHQGEHVSTFPSLCMCACVLYSSVCLCDSDSVEDGCPSGGTGLMVCLHPLKFRGDLQSLCWPARTRREDPLSQEQTSSSASSSSVLV